MALKSLHQFHEVLGVRLNRLAVAGQVQQGGNQSGCHRQHSEPGETGLRGVILAKIHQDHSVIRNYLGITEVVDMFLNDRHHIGITFFNQRNPNMATITVFEVFRRVLQQPDETAAMRAALWTQDAEFEGLDNVEFRRKK